MYNSTNTFFFTIIRAFKHRFELYSFIKNTNLQINNVYQINLKTLKEKGIKYLILDFDGVLSYHNATKPDKKVQLWLKRAILELGKKKIYILSNNRNKNRLLYFQKNFSDICFIKNKFSKPHPYDIRIILKRDNIKNLKSVLLIDDRLLTGILLSIILKIPSKFVIKPFVNVKKNTIKEIYMILLRYADTLICKILISTFPKKLS